MGIGIESAINIKTRKGDGEEDLVWSGPSVAPTCNCIEARGRESKVEG